jgi:hypothetical protein
MKYRYVGEVTRISFTYVKYEQDKPMTQRKRYDGEALSRGRHGRANDIASPESTQIDDAACASTCPRGSPARTTSLDYVDTLLAPVLLIDCPDKIISRARRQRSRRSSMRHRRSSIAFTASTSRRRLQVSTSC